METLSIVRGRRAFLLAGLGAGASAMLPFGVVAQGFPSKPVRIVVPFGPGGVGDLTARAVASKLSERWGGAPVVIDNRPGAGGVVAAETVLKSDPDGHTVFLMSNGTAVTQALFQKLPFDATQDFAPVSTLGFFDVCIAVPEGSPYKTLPELIAFAKANPKRLNVGSVNVGSTQNLAAELFKSTAGIDVQVVPYNGTPALIAAVRGGQVDAIVELLGPVLPQQQAKSVRVLAVTGEKRSFALPDVPTVTELGIAGFVVDSWNAFAVPAKTPPEVIARLNADVTAVLGDAEVQRKLRDLNVAPRAGTPKQLSDLLASDIRLWTQVIRAANIPLR